MRKLRLDLETLAVESFTTAAESRAVGTVKGHETEQFGCSAYCGTAEGTCAVQSCNYSQCQYGDSCGCGQGTFSCPYNLTCGGGQCGGTHSGGWCTEVCGGDGPSFDCPVTDGAGGCSGTC